MTSDFSRIWYSQSFSVGPDPDLRGPCEAAVLFQSWVDMMFAKHLATTNLDRIHKLELEVRGRYYLARSKLPVEHRFEDGGAPDHTCVVSVFERAIEELRQRRLELAPPPEAPTPHAVTEPPRTESRTDLAGIILGDVIPEPDP